jgi:hypothetical protein
VYESRVTADKPDRPVVTVLSKDLFGNYSKGNNAMYVALTEDESTPGTYRINYTLSRGTVLSGAVVDDEGETLQE